nr:MAG TPA: hypothetical protein [Caudoviricetes sp.]
MLSYHSTSYTSYHFHTVLFSITSASFSCFCHHRTLATSRIN